VLRSKLHVVAVVNHKKMQNLPVELKHLFALEISVKLFIPSTIDINKPSTIMQAAFERSALELFSELFGGATSYQAVGAWSSKTGGLVTENVKIVEAFATTEAAKSGMAQVVAFAEKMKAEMRQEAVALQYQNQLFFI